MFVFNAISSVVFVVVVYVGLFTIIRCKLVSPAIRFTNFITIKFIIKDKGLVAWDFEQTDTDHSLASSSSKMAEVFPIRHKTPINQYTSISVF